MVRMASAFIVISGSFALIYGMAATIGDPLAEIRLSNPPNLEYLLLAATRELRLDLSIPERFILWYRDVLTSLTQGDVSLGNALNGRPVLEGLIPQIAPTFFLVCISITLALLMGAIFGLVVALKHLGLRDFLLSTTVFLGYVAPSFWIGHLFKQYVVVALNDSVPDRDWIFLVLAFLIGSLSIALMGSFLFLTYFSSNSKELRNRFIAISCVAIALLPIGAHLLEYGGYFLLLAVALTTTLTWGLIWKKVTRNSPRSFEFGLKYGVIWFISLVLQKLLLTMPSYLKRDEIEGRPFPSFSIESVWYSAPKFWELQLDRTLHAFLPALAIAITTVAIYYQVTKNSALEALDSDYVKMARAKGISEIEIMVRHVFRNSYLSLLNTFVPNYLYLFNGVIIVELVFGWQGLGVYLLDSIFNYDLNRLMGGVFVIGCFTFVMMIMSDLLLHRIDPRIRQMSGSF